jgi:electron transfer flavoprotein alpha/beta subunit
MVVTTHGIEHGRERGRVAAPVVMAMSDEITEIRERVTVLETESKNRHEHRKDQDHAIYEAIDAIRRQIDQNAKERREWQKTTDKRLDAIERDLFEGRVRAGLIGAIAAGLVGAATLAASWWKAL